MIELKKLGEGAYHVELPNQYKVCSTFLRMNEFCDSPFRGIKNRFFTLEEYMDTYASYNDGNFTFYSDFVGFNIPGNWVRKFFKVFPEQDLLEKEKELYKVLKPVLKSKNRFFLMGTYKGDAVSTFNHELGHGFYYLNRKYKKDMDEITNSIPLKILNKIHGILWLQDYSEKGFNDEIQAFLSTSEKSFLKIHKWDIVGEKRIKKYKSIFTKAKKSFLKTSESKK